ncbi:hypothetical protein [Vibrio splendidus]|uniref:hypothetical protein n=1 Tax=Vibrio splendidus TaxID=29497 RepID=UPI00076A74A3|nr:hypothetical protein [Vibrio splendidus]PHX05509.1 hypothetical protein VSPL_29030 [Vibrio splendidus]
MKYSKVDHKKYIDVLTKSVIEVEQRDNIKGLLDEILKDLDDGLAHLFMGERCATVLRPIITDDEVNLCVFFAWSTSGSGLSDYIEICYKLAKQINAKKVTTKTARKGVVRLWERHGFKQTGIDSDGLFEIEKVLNYG